jgi:hypothetical protein
LIVFEIGADPAEVRTYGGQLRQAGQGLHTLASQGDLAGSALGSGPARTAAALGMLSRDWRKGLAELGDSVAALGDYADAVAAAFERAGG